MNNAKLLVTIVEEDDLFDGSVGYITVFLVCGNIKYSVFMSEFLIEGDLESFEQNLMDAVNVVSVIKGSISDIKVFVDDSILVYMDDNDFDTKKLTKYLSNI